MKTLLLLRHAKADLGEAEMPDYDRPLNDQGTDAAHWMGKWLKQENIQPEWIICSPAQRAKETLVQLRQNIIIPDTLIQFNERLYLAALPTLLEIIAACPQDMNNIMLVGHNPGLEELLIYLCGSNLPIQDKHKLLGTTTLARIHLPDNWQQLTPECGKLQKIIRPGNTG